MESVALDFASVATPAVPAEFSGVKAPAAHEATRPAPVKPSQHTPESPVTQKQMRRVAEWVGEAVSRLNHGIRYEIDESTDTIITKVIDRNTNEVVRQIPSQEMLDITHRLRQYVGVLLDTEV